MRKVKVFSGDYQELRSSSTLGQSLQQIELIFSENIVRLLIVFLDFLSRGSELKLACQLSRAWIIIRDFPDWEFCISQLLESAK